MRSLRIPMFVKFLVGCLTLAALLIVGGTFVFKSETARPPQGNFLTKHLRRYQGYEERAGRGMTGALEILAEDPRLRTVMVPATPAPANDEKAGEKGGDKAGEKEKGGGDKGEAAAAHGGGISATTLGEALFSK